MMNNEWTKWVMFTVTAVDGQKVTLSCLGDDSTPSQCTFTANGTPPAIGTIWRLHQDTGTDLVSNNHNATSDLSNPPKPAPTSKGEAE